MGEKQTSPPVGWGVLAVLFHEDICGAVNIYIRNHDYGVFMVCCSYGFPLTPSVR